MNKQLRDAWIARLRDPANEQLQGQMFSEERDNAACCLGQLCIAMELVRPEWDGQLDRLEEVCDPKKYYAVVLDIIGYQHKERCIDMNDGRTNDGRVDKTLSRTFLEIADYVESNIPITEDK